MHNPQIPPFGQARVLVAGDVMLDRYWHGPTGRISPEAPVPVVRVTDIEDRPGGAANVALNMAALGAKASLVGVTGDDDAARLLEERLGAAEVTSRFQKIPGLPTITKLRVVSRQQQLLRLDFEESFQGEDPAPFAAEVEQGLRDCGALVLSDYAKGALRDCQGLIALARQAGVPVLVDPKGTDFERYRGATLLTPNLAELEAVVGPVPDEKTLVAKGQELLSSLDLEALLVTRSEKGMTLIRAGKPELHLPARAREVFDVTGAGDTVISTLAVALAAGSPMEEAVALANIAAGIVVGKLGTAVVSAPELRRAVHQTGGLGRGRDDRGAIAGGDRGCPCPGRENRLHQWLLRHHPCRSRGLPGFRPPSGRPPGTGGQQRRLDHPAQRPRPPHQSAGAAHGGTGGAGSGGLCGGLRHRHP